MSPAPAAISVTSARRQMHRNDPIRSRQMQEIAVCLVGTFILAAAPRTSPKEHSRFVTADMRANVLTNAKKYDWVRQEQQRAIEAIRAEKRRGSQSEPSPKKE